MIPLKLRAVVAVTVVLVASGCGASSTAPATSSATPSATPAPDALTPLLGSVPFAPLPFAGSDGKTHMVYEFAVTNFTNAALVVSDVKIEDGQSGRVIGQLDATQLKDRLQPAGTRQGADHLGAG